MKQKKLKPKKSARRFVENKRLDMDYGFQNPVPKKERPKVQKEVNDYD